jgi:hypothetical protein
MNGKWSFAGAALWCSGSIKIISIDSSTSIADCQTDTHESCPLVLPVTDCRTSYECANLIPDRAPLLPLRRQVGDGLIVDAIE